MALVERAFGERAAKLRRLATGGSRRAIADLTRQPSARWHEDFITFHPVSAGRKRLWRISLEPKPLSKGPVRPYIIVGMRLTSSVENIDRQTDSE
jgi:hypothetical protein